MKKARIVNTEDPMHTGQDGPRSLVSSLNIEKNERHWYITVWNRGGHAGTLTVNADDGNKFVNMLIKPEFQHAEVIE